MLRTFALNSLIYGAATILTRGITIFLVPIYTRIFDPGEYGAIDMLTVVAAVVSSVVPLEVVQGIARYLPELETERARRRYASTVLWYAAASYAAFYVLAWISATHVAEFLLGDAGHEGLIRLAAAAMVGNGIFYVVQSQLHWRLRAKAYAATGFVYSVASVTVSVALVVGFQLGVAGVFIGQALGAIVGLAFAWRFTAGYFAREFDVGVLQSLLRFSVPLVPSTIGVVLALYVDRLAINALVGLAAVGIFGVAYRVASLVQLVLIGFQAAITPLIYASHRHAETPRNLERIFRTVAAISLAIWLGLALFAGEVVAVFATARYAEAALVIPLLVPAITLGGSYVFMPGLVIRKRTSVVATINVGAGVLNLLLNFALIPPFGIVGAAAATLLSAGAGFLANAMMSQRAYPVPHRWMRLALGVSGIAVIALLGLAVGSGVPQTVLKGALWVCGLGWLGAVGIVRRDEATSVGRILLRRLRRL